MDLPPGDYTVTVLDTFTDDTGRSFDLSTTGSVTVEVRDGDSGDIDFGYAPLYDISGFLWQDYDMDGVWDAGELPMDGMVVALYDGDGVYMYSVVTDASGYYVFDDELPGDYTVMVADEATWDGLNHMLSTGPSIDVSVGPDSWGNNFGYIPLYDVAGTVFLDANMNGVYDMDEPFFPDVTIVLTGTDLSGESWEVTLMTDGDGEYVFTDLPPGTYTVTVPMATDDGGDLNEMLDMYFDPTTFSPVTLTIGPAETDVDFGYAVDGDTVIEELLEYDGSGKTIGFWKHQLSVSLKGKGRAQVDEATMQTYIDGIEELYLYEPFQFDDAMEFQEAYDIMKSTSSDPVDLLQKQLLAGDMVLQGFLLQWGEYIVANYEMFDGMEIIEAKDIFDYINNSGE